MTADAGNKSAQIPLVGARIRHSSHRGTIRFVGNVDGTEGLWLGVEWDDIQRGKHNGVKDGKQYFSCRFQNSGSFIRPSAPIHSGTSFLRALIAKYNGPAPDPEESHSSRLSKIRVEVVGLDKVRLKLSNLQHLREVGLDGEDIATCDPPGEISKILASLRSMDLSLTLIPSWDIVALIATEIPHLERLALNQNRLQPVNDAALFCTAFPKLTELLLNNTRMTWRELQDVTAFMPNLRRVEFGYNYLTSLDISPTAHLTMQALNLDSNRCDSWLNICHALQNYTALQRLILTANQIASIFPLPEPGQRLPQLRHLSLSLNRLGKWSDIDALFRWCPEIQTLSLMGNPLPEDPHLGRFWRQFTIARVPTLVALDSTMINQKERVDAEIFYLSYIVQHGPSTEWDRIQEHPRWPELCNKHGRPVEHTAIKVDNKLSNRLIDVLVCQAPIRPTSDYDQIPAPLSVLRVLPSMSLRLFRGKIRKAIKPLHGGNVDLWLKMEDEQLVLMERDYDDRDLAWWGIQNGSVILFFLE